MKSPQQGVEGLVVIDLVEDHGVPLWPGWKTPTPTPTPWCATSLRSEFANASSPAFDAA
jgi:hypothetical protein